MKTLIVVFFALFSITASANTRVANTMNCEGAEYTVHYNIANRPGYIRVNGTPRFLRAAGMDVNSNEAVAFRWDSATGMWTDGIACSISSWRTWP
jgi:hypothetical protein